MKKQLVIVGTAVLLLAVGLSGCVREETDNRENKCSLIGTWAEKDSQLYWVFDVSSYFWYSQGKVYEFTYRKIPGITQNTGILEITDLTFGVETTANFEFIDCNTLKMTFESGAVNILYRQEE